MKPHLTYLLLSIAVLCGGCGSIVNPDVADHIEKKEETPSFDQGGRNSGIISEYEGGFIVTPHFRDRYNGMIKTYGDKFTPSLKKDKGISPRRDGNYFIDQQHMVYFLDMNAWRKAGIE
jgi:hypothetical protein